MQQYKVFKLENSARSVPDFIAYCGLASALRPFIRRKSRPFVAALILPHLDMLSSYTRAADEILGRKRGSYSSDEDLEVIFLDEKLSGLPATLGRLKSAKRVIMFLASPDLVTNEVSLVADIVRSLPQPTARHVRRAAWKLKTPIGEQDAEFLVAEPWSRIKLAFRRHRSVEQAIHRLRSHRPAHPVEPMEAPVSGPRLEDLSGYGEAKDWGLELARDLADWQAGRIQWDDVDRGILLSGPPGSGKTTFASALAQTCGVDLVVGSAASWQAKGHMGDMLKAMRGAFAQARSLSPCVLFIDEIDAFGDRERASDHNSDYVRQVIAGLLECLDGSEERDGVVIVGACNFPQFLDPAVTRPGRLDRHIRIPLPDETDRGAIFRWHLGGQLQDFDLASVVAASDGLSGADIEQIVRGARRVARRGTREMALTDLADLLPKPRALSSATRRVIAIHEAGHAVIGVLLCPTEVGSVAVSVADNNGAPVRTLGAVMMKPAYDVARTRSFYFDRIAIMLGGIAAEEVCLGDRSDGAGGMEGSDLVMATDIATCIEGPWGMGRSFVSEIGTDPLRLSRLRRNNQNLADRVDALLSNQFERTQSLLIEHRDAVEAVATRLLQVGHLTGPQVLAIVSAAAGKEDDTILAAPKVTAVG
ncbi:AAA family ATPase [Rhizobium sp. 18055]|uniref:AAA family ATPase n=1 Tax=Rhizobium sp. 18055 TaxID=2681403 RepID=UPI00135A2B82|nr:AAA family ATPase [Rhizobium sp. 18055]